MSYRYKLTIAYEGTPFCGWQVQPNGCSIQFLIQKSLETFFREPISLTGSGRTDAGVHALGQTAHFSSSRPCEARKLVYALNGLLPSTIRVLSSELVDPTFHARYSAIGKSYSYYMDLGKARNPFRKLYSLHIPFSLDLSLIREGISYFLGTHDFSSFANESYRGCAAHNPVKTIRKLLLIQEGELCRFEFEADGFLYKMVRNIVGTLLEVGTHKREVTSLSTLLTIKDRRRAGPAAPPHGLFLMEVHYP